VIVLQMLLLVCSAALLLHAVLFVLLFCAAE
jgi:hypothetical protein